MDHRAKGILPTQTSSVLYSTQTRGHSNVDFETTAQQHPAVKEVKNHIANDITNHIPTAPPALDTPRRSVSIRIPEEADYDGKGTTNMYLIFSIFKCVLLCYVLIT